MPESLTIRPATRSDVSHLVDWNAAMARETEAKSLDRAVLARGVTGVFDDPRRGFYLVAERAGVAVGCLLVTFEWSDWRCGDFWWIQSVYVVPDARRGGVFRALYAEAREQARAAGAVGLRLYVETENHRAQRTYAELGMAPCHYLMYEEALPSAQGA
ncbi:GNAT family N-acetyltransferase [Frateuria terrea]|uniref:Ribosomal protein S18 acetylase RimI n=1 Tax=Frateuria terrea TaxID=529704 RepID=A0A1H6TAV5_9GAMM|nr:GNAT family N-acetyltransferase [Frateuria terrea]SEI73430.1 Ribosomal protein S18 acetylase RimI [Frateuria terrea]SFP29752.1 Ribosomal protein S18 acetylase RimI [Frateuria terrea]